VRVFEVSADQVEQLKRSGQVKEVLDVELPAGLAETVAAMLGRLASKDSLPPGAVKTRLEVWRDGKPFVCGTCCPVCLFRAVPGLGFH
jgi:hypothetical protein